MLPLIRCDVFDGAHAQLCLNFNHSHQPWPRSCKIAAIAGEA
jgi:hypothetical protein